MSKHLRVSLWLNLILVGAALAAWFCVGESRFSAVSIASLFGVTAFSLMWVHYAADAITPANENDQKHWLYKSSRVIVLVLLLAHPLTINAWLINNGFGLPPNSYEKFLGSVSWGVTLGLMALIAFLLFEVRQRLKRYKRPINHLNFLAMFLVLAHDFLIGMIYANSWYKAIWWLMLLSFTFIAIKHYKSYYIDMNSRKIIAFIIIAALAIFGAAAGFGVFKKKDNQSTTSVNQPTEQQTLDSKTTTPTQQTTQPEASSDSQQKTVSQEDLAAKNGKDGNSCWVAISGTVYDLTGNHEWVNGKHSPSGGLASCGRDLTQVIGQSPHGKSVLNELPIVGKLQ